MNASFTIRLNKLRFHAYHGLHEEEAKLGNEFEVDVEVRFHPGNELITSINETCDYSALFLLIREEMKVPRKLLESLAMETVEKIHTAFPQVTFASYSITKLYAPIPNLQGTVNVHFSREFSPFS